MCLSAFQFLNDKIHNYVFLLYKLSKTNTFFSRFEGTRGEKTKYFAPNFDIICHFSSFNGNIENNTKSLETELVDGIDLVQIIENKVQDRCPGKKEKNMLIKVLKNP